MSNSPCAGQSEAAVGEWLRDNVAIGTEVVIRETHGGPLRDVRTVVVRWEGGASERFAWLDTSRYVIVRDQEKFLGGI